MINFPFPCGPETLDHVIPIIADGSEVVAAAQSDTWETIALVSLKNYKGWITSFGVTVDDPSFDYGGSLAFRLLINDGPFIAIGQGPWTNQRGSVAKPWPTMIRIPINSSVLLQARRAITVASPQTVSMVALGFALPPSISKERDAAQYRV